MLMLFAAYGSANPCLPLIVIDSHCNSAPTEAQGAKIKQKLEFPNWARTEPALITLNLKPNSADLQSFGLNSNCSWTKLGSFTILWIELGRLTIFRNAQLTVQVRFGLFWTRFNYPYVDIYGQGTGEEFHFSKVKELFRLFQKYCDQEL